MKTPGLLTEKPKKVSETSLESKMGEILNSKEFIKVIKSVRQEERNVAMGCSVQFLALFPGATKEDVIHYINHLSKIRLVSDHIGNEDYTKYSKEKAKLLFDYASEKIIRRKVDEDNKEYLSRVYGWFYKQLYIDGYVYHGFNTAFESSIKEHGIDVNKKSFSMEDVNQVRDIFYKLNPADYYNVCGWTNSSQARNYYTDNMQTIFWYVTMSPEWFSFFTGEGNYRGISLDKKSFRMAFRFRNYEAARANVEALCDQASSPSGEKISQTEKEFVMNFFEKYWNIFAEHSSNKLALVKRSVFVGDPDYKLFPYYKTLKEYYGNEYNKDDDFFDALGRLIKPFGQNEFTARPISAEAIQVVDMPQYSRIFTDKKRGYF